MSDYRDINPDKPRLINNFEAGVARARLDSTKQDLMTEPTWDGWAQIVGGLAKEATCLTAAEISTCLPHAPLNV